MWFYSPWLSNESVEAELVLFGEADMEAADEFTGINVRDGDVCTIGEITVPESATNRFI